MYGIENPPKKRGRGGCKLILMKLVLVKAGNGEKKFLHGNTLENQKQTAMTPHLVPGINTT